jgi:cleavage and polyadenylation specificity factor subunit 1
MPLDPESLNGERLILRTEYHTGAPITVSKTIARRRVTQEEYAPQSQIIYGELADARCVGLKDLG